MVVEVTTFIFVFRTGKIAAVLTAIFYNFIIIIIAERHCDAIVVVATL